MHRVVKAFKPLKASCAIFEMLLLDKSIRRSRLKLANAFGGNSVMKFCSKQILTSSTYNSVVSSGNVAGTVVKLFSRQSTMPSAQRHGCGQLFSEPHTSGTCSIAAAFIFQIKIVVSKHLKSIADGFNSRSSSPTNGAVSGVSLPLLSVLKR
uniref:Uncharacterized protein n=1 Tax=Glossina austeni TaxID=7395 RepID=A0A1A9VAA0_GLOAU